VHDGDAGWLRAGHWPPLVSRQSCPRRRSRAACRQPRRCTGSTRSGTSSSSCRRTGRSIRSSAPIRAPMGSRKRTVSSRSACPTPAPGDATARTTIRAWSTVARYTVVSTRSQTSTVAGWTVSSDLRSGPLAADATQPTRRPEYACHRAARTSWVITMRGRSRTTGPMPATSCSTTTCSSRSRPGACRPINISSAAGPRIAPAPTRLAAPTTRARRPRSTCQASSCPACAATDSVAAGCAIPQGYRWQSAEWSKDACRS
jgi:hypothetical protein